MTLRLVWRVAMLVAAAACSGGDATAGQGIFQVVSVTAGGLVIQCGTHFGVTAAVPDSLYLNVRLVNTTPNDISVTSVGSIGTVVHSSNEALVGQGVNNFNALPFRTQPVLVRAHDGDVTMTVVMPMVPMCVPPAAAIEFKDASTTLHVFTTAGLFTSVPMTLHANFVGG